MISKLIDLFTGIFEPVFNMFTTWAAISVTLHASVAFKENKKGQWKRSDAPPVVLVINRKREPIKIDGISLFFVGNKFMPLDLLLVKGESTKTTIDGRQNKTFHLKKEELIKLGVAGISSVRYLCLTDSTLQDYKFSIPRLQKNLIIRSLF